MKYRKQLGDKNRTQLSSIDSNNRLKLAKENAFNISIAGTQTHSYIHTEITSNKVESNGNFH